MIRKGKHQRSLTTSRNHFLSGLYSVFNIFGDYFDLNLSERANKSDYAALRSDWDNIGMDLTKSVEKQR